MSELLTTMLWICGVAGSVWLAFVPWQILNEIRRQGAAREAEAVRITALLQMIARGDRPAAFTPPEETAAPLQALIDGRACNAG